MPLSKRIWRNVFAGEGHRRISERADLSNFETAGIADGPAFLKTGPCRTRQYGYDAVACTPYF